MTEQAVLFGSTGSLVGVITSTEADADHGRLPNVVLLNAGLLHRIGTNRTYVKLIRRLSQLGMTGLRFDLSGIGDSRAATDGLSEPESRLRDMREAMDMLAAKTGEDRFILGGLCDGAVSAFAAARIDPRVVGMILIDAFPYRTFGYYVRRYRNRFFRTQSWLNLLTGQHPLTRWVRGVQNEDNDRPTNMFPPTSEVEIMYRDLINRGVRSLVIFPGDGTFNDRRQFGEMFPSIATDDHVQLEYFEDANHTFVVLKHQEDLVRCVEQWISKVNWPQEVPSAQTERHS
ncbi:MAG: alpha/beta fold hydrolase [Desulfobulbaceae bacterium]|nr:alpha/beta fold hydrolase [Desulfobulbaceae bacterium]